ncbi:MAG TPA: hypothetical protein VN795_00760 [Stellaceae bacterium]|nr:hypothetical protein [Stellaceae bacterium]
MDPPPPARDKVDGTMLYLHKTRGRADRAIDNKTEAFVDETRMGAAP